MDFITTVAILVIFPPIAAGLIALMVSTWVLILFVWDYIRHLSL